MIDLPSWPLVLLVALSCWRPRPPPSAAPARIVSLVPALTEMVFAMGAGDRSGRREQL